MSLNKTGYNKLEKSYRKFLWDINNEGKAKKAIIAWEEIMLIKELGGLDIRTFGLQAQVQKMRYVMQILESHNVEWVWMAKDIIKASLWLGPNKKE